MGLQTVSTYLAPSAPASAHETTKVLIDEGFDAVPATAPAPKRSSRPERGHSAPPCGERTLHARANTLPEAEVCQDTVAQGKMSWWRFGRGRRQRSCNSADRRVSASKTDGHEDTMPPPTELDP